MFDSPILGSICHCLCNFDQCGPQCRKYRGAGCRKKREQPCGEREITYAHPTAPEDLPGSTLCFVCTEFEMCRLGAESDHSMLQNNPKKDHGFLQSLFMI